MTLEPDVAGIEGDMAGFPKTMRANDDVRARSSGPQVINPKVKSGHGADALDCHKVCKTEHTVQQSRQDATMKQRLIRIDAKFRIERHPNPNAFGRV